MNFSFFDEYESGFFRTAFKCFLISVFVGYQGNLATISSYLKLVSAIFSLFLNIFFCFNFKSKSLKYNNTPYSDISL